jgi:hypothetical protein
MDGFGQAGNLLEPEFIDTFTQTKQPGVACASALRQGFYK